ncbi:MAG: tetratricopeptide repeat protein [Archangium sp.]
MRVKRSAPAHIQDEDLMPLSDETFEAQLRAERQRRRIAMSAVAAFLLAALVVFAWPSAEATPPHEPTSALAPVDIEPISLDAAWTWPSANAAVPPWRPAIEQRVDVSARLERAQKFYAAERLNEASALLDEAVALAPENFEAWLLLGEVQFDLGDRPHARESAERAVALMPLDSRVHLFRATLALDAGDLAAARAALQSVLAIDADSREGQEARAILERLERRRRG